jgi:hypothetical protein
MEGSDELHAPAASTSTENPGTHLIRGLAGSRDSLDVFEKRKISYP